MPDRGPKHERRRNERREKPKWRGPNVRHCAQTAPISSVPNRMPKAQAPMTNEKTDCRSPFGHSGLGIGHFSPQAKPQFRYMRHLLLPVTLAAFALSFVLIRHRSPCRRSRSRGA